MLKNREKHPMEGITIAVMLDGKEYYFLPRPMIAAYDLAAIMGYLLAITRVERGIEEGFERLSDEQKSHFQHRKFPGWSPEPPPGWKNRLRTWWQGAARGKDNVGVPHKQRPDPEQEIEQPHSNRAICPYCKMEWFNRKESPLVFNSIIHRHIERCVTRSKEERTWEAIDAMRYYEEDRLKRVCMNFEGCFR